MVQLLFLGLDGATWDILDPFLEAGKLPTLNQLIQDGARGRLRSTHPAVTYPAWRVLSSGKHPGKLGVYGWNHPDFQQGTFTYPNSGDYRTRDVWDYAAQAGYQTAVLNQPGTYPPLEINGILLSGPESQGDNIVHPPNRNDLADQWARQSHGIANKVRHDDLDRVDTIIHNHVDLAINLADDVDILHHVIFLTDTVQHHLWNDQDALEHVWTTVDDALNRLLEATQPDTLLAASDHGFQPLEHIVSVNEILAEEGYATLEPPSGTSLLGKLGLTRGRILRWAETIGITEESLSKLPTGIKNRIPEAGGGLGTRRESAVHWHDTVALTGDGKGVYVTDPSKIDDIQHVLQARTGPDGEPLFAAVRKAEDVWHGPFLDQAPDLLIEPRDGVEPNGAIGTQPIREPVPGGTWIAHHHPEGVVFAWGDGVNAGRIEEASIVDIMPSLLAVLEAPIPTDIDGDVLPVIDRDPGRCDPLPLPGQAPAYSREEEEAIEQRLEDLGYL